MADSDTEGEGNLLNYKGIYFNDDPNSKYTCPRTGAHFEFNDMCNRLDQVIKWRKLYEQKIAAYAMSGKGHNGITQVIIDQEELKKMITKDRQERTTVDR